MSKEDLKRLDQEDEKFVDELTSTEKSMTLDKLLGFKLAKSKCFVPRRSMWQHKGSNYVSCTDV